MGARKKTWELRAAGEQAFFAASNSRHGFHSYYESCFDRPQITQLYAIKGGPGTGKSRLMREVMQEAERRGWRGECVYCSSDPDSLDGVILWKNGEGIALLDATAPHVYEPTRPGLRENLINLGAFWSSESLRERSADILALNNQKKSAYRRAYRYLSAYGEVSDNRNELVAPYIKKHRIGDCAARLLQSVPNGSCFSAQPALMRSVGMQGAVSLDSYLAKAKKIFWIEDCHGSAYCLTEALYRIAYEKKLSIRISKDPILYDQTDGLFLNGVGYAFVVGEGEECPYPCKRISMRRFTDTAHMREVREAVHYAERFREAMLQGALEELEQVRLAHFQIEEIYVSAMDFQKKEAFTKKLCEEILHLKSE